MVALELYAAVLGGTSGGAFVLQLLGEIVDIDVVLIDSIDDCYGLAVPAAVDGDPDGLLLTRNLRAHAELVG